MTGVNHLHGDVISMNQARFWRLDHEPSAELSGSGESLNVRFPEVKPRSYARTGRRRARPHARTRRGELALPAMDQPLVEPEVRRSANGELRTSLRCAYAYRDIGGFRLNLRSY